MYCIVLNGVVGFFFAQPLRTDYSIRNQEYTLTHSLIGVQCIVYFPNNINMICICVRVQIDSIVSFLLRTNHTHSQFDRFGCQHAIFCCQIVFSPLLTNHNFHSLIRSLCLYILSMSFVVSV